MSRWAMAAFEMLMPLALVTAIEMRVVRQGKTLPRLRRRLASLNAIKVANHNEKSREAWTIVRPHMTVASIYYIVVTQ